MLSLGLPALPYGPVPCDRVGNRSLEAMMRVTELFTYRFGRKARREVAVELVKAYARKPTS